VLASLKSKQEKEFIFAMDKREQREVDDLVVTRHENQEDQGHPPRLPIFKSR